MGVRSAWAHRVYSESGHSNVQVYKSDTKTTHKQVVCLELPIWELQVPLLPQRLRTNHTFTLLPCCQHDCEPSTAASCPDLLPRIIQCQSARVIRPLSAYDVTPSLQTMVTPLLSAAKARLFLVRVTLSPCQPNEVVSLVCLSSLAELTVSH